MQSVTSIMRLIIHTSSLLYLVVFQAYAISNGWEKSGSTVLKILFSTIIQRKGDKLQKIVKLDIRIEISVFTKSVHKNL